MLPRAPLHLDSPYFHLVCLLSSGCNSSQHLIHIYKGQGQKRSVSGTCPLCYQWKVFPWNLQPLREYGRMNWLNKTGVLKARITKSHDCHHGLSSHLAGRWVCQGHCATRRAPALSQRASLRVTPFTVRHELQGTPVRDVGPFKSNVVSMSFVSDWIWYRSGIYRDLQL